MSTAAVRMWGSDDCERAHEATLAVLADPGVVVQNARARELLAAAGAKVDGSRVSIPATLVKEALETAPRSFPVKSRGGHESLVMEQGNVYYGTGGDCLYIRDLDSGDRRRARLDDVESLAALSERLPGIDFVMSMSLPEDAPEPGTDVAVFAALLRSTCKPLLICPVCTPETMTVLQRMAGLAGEPNSFILYAMSSPPLMHSEEALGRVMACAELTIPVVYSAGACGGFSAPASRSAVVVNSNAEVFTGLVVSQLVKPGAPFILGSTAPSMSMRTSNIVYNSPNTMAMQQALCDLGRHVGLPTFNIGGCSDSKALDGQWAAEAAVSLALAGLAGGTLVHDLGYLESGLQSSHESILFTDELVGYVRAYVGGVPLDDIEAAVDEIRAAGPGGDHLSRPYTRKHFRDFWQPTLLDQRVHDRWQRDGSMGLRDRLAAKARQLRSEPPAFQLDTAVIDELDAITSAAKAL